MAKIIKSPLAMADGVMVRTIEELRENFDIKRVMGYFLDGKLSKWLEARYYDDELKKVNELLENDSELAKKLCDIFGVEYIEESKIDIEDIKEEKKKHIKLKKYTDDEEILAAIDCVAFNQEELDKLYTKGIEKIYLCEGEFIIPEEKSTIEYHIIGEPSVEGLFKKSDGHSDIDEELALLIGSRNYVESERFVIWKSDNIHNSNDSVFFKSKNATYSTKDICVWDKIENKYYTSELKHDSLFFSLVGFAGDLLVANVGNFTHIEDYVYFYKCNNNSFEYVSKKQLNSSNTPICNKYVAYMPYGTKKINIFNAENQDEISTAIEFPSGIISHFFNRITFELFDNKLFYVLNNAIYEYDFINLKTKLLYENSKIHIRRILCVKDDELFIEYFEESSHRTVLCGIKNGITTDYFGGSMGENDKIYCTANSSFLIFPKFNGIEILNIQDTATVTIPIYRTRHEILNFVGDYLILKIKATSEIVAIDLSNPNKSEKCITNGSSSSVASVFDHLETLGATVGGIFSNLMNDNNKGGK